MSRLFNFSKNDYEQTPLIFGTTMGLMDTLHRPYPEIWDLYKKMKSMDWDEQEFAADFMSCRTDFATCDKTVYDMMIINLAYQWEADSTASRAIISTLAPIISSTDLWTAWQRISDNESVHAATYSEIVRCGFEDTSTVMQEILNIQQAQKRLTIIVDVFEQAYEASLQYALDRVYSQELYDKIFMFVVALYCLERIQFMASFAITFAIAQTGLFMPIGKAVQKICIDEYFVHAPFDQAVLNRLMQTEEGLMAFNRNRDKIKKLIDDVVQSEYDWLEFAFSEGRELTGVDIESLNKWVLWNAKPVYEFFSFSLPTDTPTKSPLHFMDDWINISKVQGAPQEQKLGSYLLGGFIRDTDNLVFDTKGI